MQTNISEFVTHHLNAHTMYVEGELDFREINLHELQNVSGFRFAQFNSLFVSQQQDDAKSTIKQKINKIAVQNRSAVELQFNMCPCGDNDNLLIECEAYCGCSCKAVNDIANKCKRK